MLTAPWCMTHEYVRIVNQSMKWNMTTTITARTAVRNWIGVM